MAVIIDIPGIGNIEAKNAASEKTLQEILKVMQGVQRNTTGGGGGGAAGGAKNVGGALNTLAKGSATTASKFTKLGGAAGMVAGALVSLGEGVTKTISQFANVGDSVEAAANVFSAIPILGTMFSAVAQASQKVNDAYLDSAKSGATFGGSVNDFARAASGAGMTLEKFGAFVQRNGFAMTAFGDTTETGAKRFSQVAKQLQASASGLQALGFTTEDINQGLASYGELLKLQGRSTNKTNAELTAGATKYLKEMDALAKITGEERAAKEAEAKRLAQDAQFQAATANMDEKAAASFRNTVLSLPAPLQGFVKDFLATGTLTSEETQRIGSIMGQGVMAELQHMRNIMRSGGELTAAQQDRFRQILAAAGKNAQKNFGDTFAATREFDGAMQAATSAASLNTDAHKDAAKSQADAEKNTDGMNARMQEAQKTIARISNEFKMFLANSGILESMLTAFKAFAGFVQTFLMPIFSGLGMVIKIISDVIQITLAPAFYYLKTIVNALLAPFQAMSFYFKGTGDTLSKVYTVLKDNFLGTLETVSNFISDTLLDTWYSLFDTIQDYVMPVFNFLGRVIGSIVDVLKGAFLESFKMVSDWFKTSFLPAFKAVSDFFKDVFKPVLDPVVEVFNKIKTAVGDFFRSFNTMGEVITSLKLSFKGLILNLKEMWYAIKDFIPGLKDATPEERAALEAEKEELAENRARHDEVLANNRQKNLEEQKKQEASREKERNERDKKLAKERSERDKKVADAGVEAAKKSAEEKNKIDATAGPEALLKQFAKAEGSPLVPKSEQAKNAETTKKEIERKAEEKAKTIPQTEVEKEAEQRKKEKESGSPAAPTQESAESLLAQLNTNMARLVRIASEQKDIGERQLGVQRSLSGDLFAA